MSDLGKGLGVAGPARIFDTFYTTKPDRLGMGLSISRSIFEPPNPRPRRSTHVDGPAVGRLDRHPTAPAARS